MPRTSAPWPGDVYLKFNGLGDFVEIPGTDRLSVDTTGALTIAAWMRPDILNFPKSEGSGYIHWLGKGESGRQEWTFRMYNRDNTREIPPRPNRISFYVFNPPGDLGVGSYVQDTVEPGRWIHVVGVMDFARTHIYSDGIFRGCDTYRGPSDGNCPLHYIPGTRDQLVMVSQGGAVPLRLGTRDFHSFLQGGLTGVRVWKTAHPRRR
jgi:hypothetical protein